MVRGQSVTDSNSEERRIIEEIEALIEELELLKGEGSVILAVVNSRDVKERLINKIDERFNAEVLEVKSGQEIIDTLKKDSNFEVLVLVLPDELTEDILNALNNYRELFYRCGFPSVVICNLDALNKIIKDAPDFWRYRGSVYDLTVSKVGEVLYLFLSSPLTREFRNLEEIDRFINMCNRLLSIVKNDDERARLLIELADAYLHKSRLTGNEKDLKMAEDLLIKAIDTAKNDNYKGLALLLYSVLLINRGELEKAIKIIESMKNLKYKGRLGSIIHLSSTLQLSLFEMYFLSKLFKLFKEIKEEFKLSEGVSSHLEHSIKLLYMAIQYMLLEEYGKAEESLKKALKFAEEAKDRSLICRTYLNFARLYIAMGNLKKAKDFAEKALKIAEELKNEFLIKEAKDLLERIRNG
jgi:tetratricopeptide (TPR) repeat protein